jgi:hypothetical protein
MYIRRSVLEGFLIALILELLKYGCKFSDRVSVTCQVLRFIKPFLFNVILKNGSLLCSLVDIN